MRKDALVADVISSPIAWHSASSTSVTGQHPAFPQFRLASTRVPLVLRLLVIKPFYGRPDLEGGRQKVPKTQLNSRQRKAAGAAAQPPLQG